ncbi:MAG: fused MFS/spermidine synthase, partial [Candidatus Andersenbacteria bacterium]|nr:fused MFS/spermidine synthase [Candidatus Andersenbacteria bacterium]
MASPAFYRFTNWYWYAFLLAAGAASTAVEMTGLRFLAPLFGSSLPVWGAAIATVIAGLAWGYARGGRQAERMTSSLLPYQTAALGAAVFLWTPAAYRLAALLRDLSLNQNAGAAISGAFGVSFLALLIPSVVFGTLTPLAVQVEAARRRIPAGTAAGRVFTVTTIGSLVGIIVPSFFTIQLFGTTFTVWLFAGILLILAGGQLLTQFRAGGALLAAFSLLTSFLPPPKDPAVLLAVETPYQHVIVREQSGRRSLAFDAHLGTQSVITNSDYTDGYWDYLAALPAFLPANEQSVLVLGAAASTTERQLQRLWRSRNSFHLTSVELDGALLPIAQASFDPPQR